MASCSAWPDAHRCLTPDLPGFGRSEVPRDFDCSLDGWSAWVDDVVRALDVTTPIDLVVHDFGGLFGIAWAVRHPERVRRLVDPQHDVLPRLPLAFLGTRLAHAAAG